MKYLPLLLTLIPTLAFSKTRLNDYYVGFEIATVDHDTIDGELFDLSANMPLEGAIYTSILPLVILTIMEPNST